MYDSLLALDKVKINFSQDSSFILNIILAFIMFGVALGIHPAEFKGIFKKPKSLIVGLTAQMVFLPAMTFLIIIIFYKLITPTIAMGMILVAACPGGNISNFINSLSKANVELSVSMTAINTIAAIITTPFNFAFWGSMYEKFLLKHSTELLQPLTIDPYQMFFTVFIILGIPLICGLLFTHFFPKLSDKISPVLQKLSILFFVLMIVVAFSNNIDVFLNYIFYIFLIVLVHNGMALLTGFTSATAFGLNKRDRRAITIEVGIQNSGLGLALLFNPKIFPQDAALGGMLLVVAWWGIWHIVSGLSVGGYWHFHPVKNEN